MQVDLTGFVCCDRLTSLSTMSSGLVYVVFCVGIPLLFKAE